MSTSLLSRLARAGLDLVFPPRCVLCGRSGPFLCPDCASSLPRALPPRCRRCWRPLRGEEPCRECIDSPLAAVRASFLYQGPVRGLIHALKYDGQTALAAPMAGLMVGALPEPVADLLVPVPLFGRRRRSRGYNQSALLAREVARLPGAPPLEDRLARLRSTPPQARSATAAERRRNVEGAFAWQGPPLDGRSVLLVDDVTTTGATLEACAVALRGAGAGPVSALTFARED